VGGDEAVLIILSRWIENVVIVLYCKCTPARGWKRSATQSDKCLSWRKFLNRCAKHYFPTKKSDLERTEFQGLRWNLIPCRCAFNFEGRIFVNGPSSRFESALHYCVSLFTP